MPSSVSFSISGYAAWAPGVETLDSWLAWANSSFPIRDIQEPAVKDMPPMLRRRAGFLGKMALEVAYRCVCEHKNVATIFCSRHGEVSRSLEMLSDLAKGQPLSPASFGLSVHNSIGGLFSIARTEKVNNIALAGGTSTVETAIIEACGLLDDGEPRVLLVVYDCPLPTTFAEFQDVDEQPYSWAWMIEPPNERAISLTWSANPQCNRNNVPSDGLPHGLEIFRSFLMNEDTLEHTNGHQRWVWCWNA